MQVSMDEAGGLEIPADGGTTVLQVGTSKVRGTPVTDAGQHWIRFELEPMGFSEVQLVQ